MMLVLAAPALPLHKAGPYVAAAYIVFAAILLIYLSIMAVRLGRTQRELTRLQEEVRHARASSDEDHASEELESLA
jgi:hypothetical protein